MDYCTNARPFERLKSCISDSAFSDGFTSKNYDAGYVHIIIMDKQKEKAGCHPTFNYPAILQHL